MKILRKLLLIVTAAFALAVSPPAVKAATWNDFYGMGNKSDDWFMSGSGVPFTVVTSVHSNALYYITSGYASGSAVIEDVSFKTDWCGTGSAISYYVVTNTWTISSNAPAGTNQIWLTTTNNALATNDICTVQDVGNDAYQMIVISGNATDYAGTVLTNALGEVLVKTFNTISNALTTGDKLYKMSRVFTVNPLTITSLTNSVVLNSSQNSSNSCFSQWLPLTFSGFGSTDRVKFKSKLGTPSLVVLTLSNAGGLFVNGSYQVRPRR